MKRALCLFTLAAALSTGAIAAAPLPAGSPACPAPEAAALSVDSLDAYAVVFAAAAATPKVAQCPRPGINCPDVYDPVTCSNGKTYPNSCYAYVACATGCGAS